MIQLKRVLSINKRLTFSNKFIEENSFWCVGNKDKSSMGKPSDRYVFHRPPCQDHALDTLLL